MNRPSLRTLLRILGFFVVPKGKFKKRYCILPTLYIVTIAYVMGVNVTDLYENIKRNGMSLFSRVFAFSDERIVCECI